MSESGWSFDLLCRELAPRLRRFCAARLGDDALAEDIAQETLLRAWEHRHDLDPARDPAPWLFAVARNLCTDAARLRSRTLTVAELPDTPEPHDDPGARVEAADERALVRTALDAMPARQREMLMLREVERLGCPAVARRLGVSEPTVRVLLVRARRRLRELLVAAMGVVALAFGAARSATIAGGRRVSRWGTAAPGVEAVALNAVIGLGLATALAVPSPSTAGTAVGATAPRAAAPAADEATARIAPPVVRLVSSVDAFEADRSVQRPRAAEIEVRAALPSSEAGDGDARARTWRRRDSKRSLILSALDDACARVCAIAPPTEPTR